MYFTIAYFLAALLAAVTLLCGWVMNFAALVMHFESMSQSEVLIRLVGLPVAVLGAAVGFMW